MTGVVHIVGTVVDVGPRTRQCCAWCGVVLLNYDLTRLAMPLDQDAGLALFPPGALLLVDGNCKAVVAHEDGDPLPDNACAWINAAVTT